MVPYFTSSGRSLATSSSQLSRELLDFSVDLPSLELLDEPAFLLEDEASFSAEEDLPFPLDEDPSFLPDDESSLSSLGLVMNDSSSSQATRKNNIAKKTPKRFITPPKKLL
jgi:hypothetical protein